jgi:hypothetical protein
MKRKFKLNKNKITVILLFLFLILMMFPASTTANDTIKTETHHIRIALYAEDVIIISGVDVWVRLLDRYQWTVGNITYQFDVTPIYDKDIYRGHLTTATYDVLFMPGGGGGGYVTLTKSHPNLQTVKIWKKQIINFVKDGGSYAGVCGGTYSLLGLDRLPQTPFERKFDQSAINISCVKLSFTSWATPIFCQWVGLRPDAIGSGAYLYYTGWNRTGIIYSGVPLDVSVNRSHPIFDGYLNGTVRFRWIGGPAYTLPIHPNRDVSVVARYPTEEISENPDTQIHAWQYIGGIRGFLPSSIQYFFKENTALNGLLNVYVHAGDWKKTDTIIQTNFSDKPFITAEVYPNDNAARIFLCAGHPEYYVWWGGHIVEANDTAHNTLYSSLYRWTDIIPENQTLVNEATYNWWLARRAIAWCAKIPIYDLPPVYGASQVIHIIPYEQPAVFSLAGNVEHSSGEVTLDVYYRYSTENISWGLWTYYGTDANEMDGWHWTFDAGLANGPGYYQFYSVRRVHQADEWVNETVPPGPDAITHISLKTLSKNI